MGKKQVGIVLTRRSVSGALAGLALASAYLVLDPRAFGWRILIAAVIVFAAYAIGIFSAVHRRETLRVREILDLREELRASQDHIMESATFRSLGAYLEIAGHQMTDPLRGVVSGAEKFAAETSLSDDNRAEAGALHEKARELENTLHHVASYRLTKPGRAPFSVNTLLQQALLLCRYRAGEKRIRIEEEYAIVPPVFGPAERIEGALLNVLINAIEAMPFEGGTIRVESFLDQDRVMVTVTDMGIGIRPEHVDRVFDPFFTTKPEKNGGLGLWAARQMLDIIGADIRIESAPFKGTKATVSFQRAAPLRPGREGTENPPELPRNTADDEGRQIA